MLPGHLGGLNKIIGLNLMCRYLRSVFARYPWRNKKSLNSKNDGLQGNTETHCVQTTVFLILKVIFFVLRTVSPLKVSSSTLRYGACLLAASFPGIPVKTRARSAPASPAEREIRELAALRQPYF